MPASPHTPADEGFKYVGGSYGYFLSKYDWREHKFEQAVRWGYMFIEEGDAYCVLLYLLHCHNNSIAGTAMDFQASDIIGALLGACTPGDIRVHYTAQFIDVASIMGTAHPSQDLITTQTVSIKGGGSSRESYRLGVVHKGVLSAPEMLQKELAEGRCDE
jgi:hypothetical protein